MKKNNLMYLLLSGMILLLSGCVAANSRIVFTAKNAKFPISMTGFYGQDYNLMLIKDYQYVNTFSLVYKKFTINWIQGLIAPKHVDLSEELSNLVKKYDGDAIVNLNAKVETTKLNDWLGVFRAVPGYFTLGIISPSQVQVTITGSVVKIPKTKSELFNQHENEFLVIFKDGKTEWLPKKI
jgi:hypothetical protein